MSSALDHKTQTRLWRNEEGVLDPKGKLGKRKSVLHMKFTDEVHFCSGVALIDGEGTRLDPFECTSKKVVLHREWEKVRDTELKRVSELTGQRAPCYQNTQPAGSVHLNDPITCLKGVGRAKEKKLQEAGIHAVKDFLDYTIPPEGLTVRE